MRHLPYVGVASIATLAEVEGIVERWHPPTGWLLNLGFQVTDKTRNRQPISERWQPRMPSIDLLPSLLQFHTGIFNSIHVNTDHPESLDEQLLELETLVGGHLDAFQLNMTIEVPWPSKTVLRRFTEAYPEYRMILQVNGAALVEVERDPLKLAQRLYSYDGIITDVIFDESLGTGRAMNAEQISPYIQAMAKHLPSLGQVVAGGLGPGGMGPWAELQKQFEPISCDAESRLRDAQNRLDLTKVSGYFFEVASHLHRS